MIPAAAISLTLMVGGTPLTATAAPSPEASVSAAVMTTCYGLVGGDDILAAERSIQAGSLIEGPPVAFPDAARQAFMDVPGASARAYHAEVSTGSVLVVFAPDVRLCTVAYSGSGGQAIAAEIDRWFNGPPSPFQMTSDHHEGSARTRTYRPAENTDHDMVVMTTVLDDEADDASSVRFWATLSRVGYR